MQELKSERGIRLITQKASCSMLTVEDYLKWYDVYITNEQGEVTGVVRRNIDDKASEIYFENWFDHCITPIGFLELAQELKAKVDQQSYTDVIARFIQNHYDKDRNAEEFVIDSEYLPSEELKLAVLI